MSHTYSTSTYAATPDQIPKPVEAPEQFDSLANAAYSEQSASPGKLVYVAGDTRSGWAIYTVKSLANAVGLPSLQFLSDQGQHKFETEHGFTCVSVLSGDALVTAIGDLKRLLGAIKANPRIVLDADDAGVIDVTNVETVMKKDYVSSKPAYDYGNVVGDDGQTADYLLTWLRSVLRVAELAHAEGRAVIHVLVV